MKVLITGASGLLGKDVWKQFSEKHQVIALGRSQPPQTAAAQWRPCDLRDAAATYGVVTRENPDLIVHCASYNDVDGAESHREDAFGVNAIGTRNLALACQRFDTVLMAVSTDYVFSGKNAPDEGYREFDTPEPQSIYAHSKRWAERYVEQLLNKFYIVRTSWLFGEGRASYVDKVLEWGRADKTITCITDMCSAPTYTADLAKALLLLGESGLFGLYHLTNAGFCTRLELAREILRLHKLPDNLIRQMTQSEFKHAAQRPTFSGLQNLTWQTNGFAPLRSWKDALKDHFSATLAPR